MTVAHDDEEEDGLIGVDTLSESPDAKGCLNHFVEGVGLGNGVDF